MKCTGYGTRCTVLETIRVFCVDVVGHNKLNNKPQDVLWDVGWFVPKDVLTKKFCQCTVLITYTKNLITRIPQPSLVNSCIISYPDTFFYFFKVSISGSG